MKLCIKTITWKFKDASESYPELKNKQVKITSPTIIFENFNFLFKEEVKEKFVVFG
ncbi:MAG: hypothetical protein WAR79_10750 [Melioribacteraceae bacterium]